MPEITAELSDEELLALTTLANKRGVTANDVLKQAIMTERVLDQNVDPSDKVIVKKSANSAVELVFSGQTNPS
jgi:hypothetical protein